MNGKIALVTGANGRLGTSASVASLIV